MEATQETSGDHVGSPISIQAGIPRRTITLSPRLADPRLNLTQRVVLEEVFDLVDLTLPKKEPERPTVDLVDLARLVGTTVEMLRDAVLDMAAKGLFDLGPTTPVDFDRLEVVGLQITVDAVARRGS